MFTDFVQIPSLFQLPLALSKPSEKLNLFQDSFSQSGGYLGAFWFVLGAIILVALILAVRQWVLASQMTSLQRTQSDHLFDNLLDNIGLSRNERYLLLEIAHGSRLKHPAMCLLSPGLLRTTCDLWVKEKKISPRKAGYKIEQLDRLCWKVFGQQLAA